MQQRRHPVFLLHKSAGDRNPRAHEAKLFDLHAKYADVPPRETVPASCRDLARDAAARRSAALRENLTFRRTGV